MHQEADKLRAWDFTFYEKVSWNNLAKDIALKAKFPMRPVGQDFTCDAESHVNYLSLYFIHQIGIIQSSCKYGWLTLAQATLFGLFHPSSLFILQLPVYCWISSFIMRHREHWTPPPFLRLCGKQWHRTSLYRDFWPLAGLCLRQLWNRYARWQWPMEVSHSASVATWGKSSFYRKLYSPVKLSVYSWHAAWRNRYVRGGYNDLDLMICSKAPLASQQFDCVRSSESHRSSAVRLFHNPR